MSINRNEPVYVTKGVILDLIEEEKQKISTAAAKALIGNHDHIDLLEQFIEANVTDASALDRWKTLKAKRPEV